MLESVLLFDNLVYIGECIVILTNQRQIGSLESAFRFVFRMARRLSANSSSLVVSGGLVLGLGTQSYRGVGMTVRQHHKPVKFV